MRRPGGGRKKLSETDPELAAQLRALVEPQTRGDPVSLLVWTTKSTKNLAAALAAAGHPVSDRTVARMLHAVHKSQLSPAGAHSGDRSTPRQPEAIAAFT